MILDAVGSEQNLVNAAVIRARPTQVRSTTASPTAKSTTLLLVPLALVIRTMLAARIVSRGDFGLCTEAKA